MRRPIGTRSSEQKPRFCSCPRVRHIGGWPKALLGDFRPNNSVHKLDALEFSVVDAATSGMLQGTGDVCGGHQQRQLDQQIIERRRTADCKTLTIVHPERGNTSADLLRFRVLTNCRNGHTACKLRYGTYHGLGAWVLQPVAYEATIKYQHRHRKLAQISE